MIFNDLSGRIPAGTNVQECLIFKDFICGRGVKCDCGTAANLLCGRCLWCHADHVKHWPLFRFVLHGHTSMKELIRAKREECCRRRWKPLKTQRNVWEAKLLILPRKRICKCDNLTFGGGCCIDWWCVLFSSEAEDVNSWSVSPPGVWMGGGVLRGGKSRLEDKTGECLLVLLFFRALRGWRG